jgi:hypothetical protein
LPLPPVADIFAIGEGEVVMSRVAALIAILVLSVEAAGMYGSAKSEYEGVATATFLADSTAVVVAGEFPWQQRGH